LIGFHGLSYEYLTKTLQQEYSTVHKKKLPSKIIMLHLGHGCSMAAVREGKCIDTTMGFSPCGGFPMSTRCGDLDPEVVLYLIQHEGVAVKDMKNVLNKQCGLVAFSSKGDDMRDLEASRYTDPAAKLALDYFIYHLVKHLCGLVGALGGVDMIVFTAGIGENSVLVRKLICDKLYFLGVLLEDDKNNEVAVGGGEGGGVGGGEKGLPVPVHGTISTEASRVVVRVIPTNEELVIAQQSLEVANTISTISSSSSSSAISANASASATLGTASAI
jgi:acetate kinase